VPCNWQTRRLENQKMGALPRGGPGERENDGGKNVRMEANRAALILQSRCTAAAADGLPTLLSPAVMVASCSAMRVAAKPLIAGCRRPLERGSAGKRLQQPDVMCFPCERRLKFRPVPLQRTCWARFAHRGAFRSSSALWNSRRRGSRSQRRRMCGAPDLYHASGVLLPCYGSMHAYESARCSFSVAAWLPGAGISSRNTCRTGDAWCARAGLTRSLRRLIAGGSTRPPHNALGCWRSAACCFSRRSDGNRSSSTSSGGPSSPISALRSVAPAWAAFGVRFRRARRHARRCAPLRAGHRASAERWCRRVPCVTGSEALPIAGV